MLQQPPERIDIKFLERFPEFIEFRYTRKKTQNNADESTSNDQEPKTPEEMLEAAYLKIRSGLVSEVLERIDVIGNKVFDSSSQTTLTVMHSQIV